MNPKAIINGKEYTFIKIVTDIITNSLVIQELITEHVKILLELIGVKFYEDKNI